MVELHVDPWCNNCPEFQAEVEREVSNDYFGTGVHYFAFVRCCHRDRCRSIKNYIENAKEETHNEN